MRFTFSIFAALLMFFSVSYPAAAHDGTAAPDSQETIRILADPNNTSQNPHVPMDPEPGPSPEPAPNIGSVLVSFNLADLEPGAMDRASGLQLEADLKVPGTVLSFVGHVSDHGEVKFQGAGPRVTHDLGPFSLFGHYLFGNLSAGGMATAGLDAKKGGGVEVPIGRRVVIRIGADHDGTTLYSIFGVGVRF